MTSGFRCRCDRRGRQHSHACARASLAHTTPKPPHLLRRAMAYSSEPPGLLREIPKKRAFQRPLRCGCTLCDTPRPPLSLAPGFRRLSELVVLVGLIRSKVSLRTRSRRYRAVSTSTGYSATASLARQAFACMSICINVYTWGASQVVVSSS